MVGLGCCGFGGLVGSGEVDGEDELKRNGSGAFWRWFYSSCWSRKLVDLRCPSLMFSSTSE